MARQKGRKRKGAREDTASGDEAGPSNPPAPASGQDAETQQPPPKKPKLRLKVAPPKQVEVEAKEGAGEKGAEEQHTYFDCEGCGIHGADFEDGQHCIACDECQTWQHSKCHGLTPEQAEKEGFAFVCSKCRGGGAEKDGDDGEEEENRMKLTTQSRASPNGSRLCSQCGERYRLRKDGSGEKWRISRKMKPESMAGSRCENCPEPLGPGNNSPGPKGRLCRRCGHRYRDNPHGDAWRVPQKVRIAPGATCENCQEPLGPTNNHAGPKGRLCRKCGLRYKDNPHGDAWRVPQKTRIKFDHTCSDCGRHDGDDWEGSLCGSCAHRQFVGGEARPANSTLHDFDEHTYAALRDLAHRQFRQLLPQNAFTTARTRPSLGPNYWFEGVEPLFRTLTERGIHHGGQRRLNTKRQAISVLQLDDAWNGILPRADPSSTSYLHTLSYEDLILRAKEAGFHKANGTNAKLNADIALTFLQGKRDATDDIQKIDPEILAMIRRAVGTTAQSSNTLEPTHQSHNGGIVAASAGALSRLHITLSNGHYPTWTSSIGYQCGPIALANTMHAVRNRYYATTAEGPLYHWTQEELRQLLFLNAEDAGSVDEFGNPMIGIPTPEYQAYLDELLGDREEDDRGVEHHNMTQLNNMHWQQLVAMVVLLHRAGRIEEEFNVGIVTNVHNGPATAQIVHEGGNNASTLWLHHNAAASDDEYSHWEGFQEPRSESDFDIVAAWGLGADPITADTPRTAWSRKSPTSNEDTMSRAVRQLRAASALVNSLVNSLVNAGAKACKQCVKADRVRQCKRTSGHRYCDPCDEDGEADECEWPHGSAESILGSWKQANELTDDDIRAWDRPLGIAEEDMMRRSLTGQLEDVPEGSHFLVIPCARKSSHPGAMNMLNLLQCLLVTQNNYDNMLNDPAYQQFREGQRPGGPGTQMRSHRVSIARRGLLPIPTHHGNLVDPMLHAFINLMDQLLAVGNNNLPIEIHFLLHGIAGFSVDIDRWGSRTHGFFSHVLSADAANATNGNHTDIAGSIYIVAVMELHVVSPNSPSSINHGNPAHGVQKNNKRIVKYRLADLIDRRAQLVTHAAGLNNGHGMPFAEYMRNVLLLHTGNQPAGGFPNPPPWGGPAWQAPELDRFIMAMFWEFMWRANHLDNTTIPPDAHVNANNGNRNAPL